MIINLSLNNEKIKLVFDKPIPSLVRIQLINFYKFENTKNDLEIIKNFNKENFFDLVSYLNENKYKLIFSNNLNSILKENEQLGENFNLKIKNLTDIKKNINSHDFKDYCNFLDTLKRKLKDHQKRSSYHLYKSEAAANFSVPGSGKTSVVLSYYQKLKDEGKVDAIFIIGPVNCFYSWEDEFKLTLDRDPKFKILRNNREDFYLNKLRSELIATHFKIIVNDIENLKNFFKKYKFLLVIDEAHNIKKIEGTWSKFVLELGRITKYKVILTGTPMPNDFKDFYNYLEFLYDKNEIISDYEKAQIEVFMDRKKTDEAVELLSNKINPFYTRVTKKDLGLSKPNFCKPLLIEMNDVEKKIHYSIISKIKYFSKKKYLENIEFIKKIRRARVIRLMQTCSYAKNLISAIPDYNVDRIENLIEDSDLRQLISNYDNLEKPAKLIKLLEIINNLANQNKKILIWSGHLRTIDLIKKHLQLDNYKVKVITGKTPLSERGEIKTEFNDKHSNLDVVIANPQACSESISLHKACQDAVYYDQNFNTAEFLQSLDRIHRVGGSEDEPVFYNFLQYENTIEQKVYKKIREKADRQMQVIEKENLTFSPTDEDDWEDLYKDLEI